MKKTANISLGTIVQTVLIILKLFRLISWKWIWVLCPTWIGLAIALLVILIYAISN